MRGLTIAVFLLLVTGCTSATRKVEPGLDVPLAAGMGQEFAQGSGGVPCQQADQAHREQAIDQALRDAVRRAALVSYGDLPDGLSARPFVAAYKLRRYWADDHNCFASVEAVVDVQSLQKHVRASNRDELSAVGRPQVVFAVASYRILPIQGVTSRRHAAEPIDALQREFIARGFDVYRSAKAREGALDADQSRVLDVNSLDRERIAQKARADHVRFLVQGELKITDEGKVGDQYLAVVDGSIEIVDLQNDQVVGSYIDVASKQHLAASAAYTGAVTAYARAAAATLAPAMLDVLQHAALPGSTELAEQEADSRG